MGIINLIAVVYAVYSMMCVAVGLLCPYMEVLMTFGSRVFGRHAHHCQGTVSTAMVHTAKNNNNNTSITKISST